MESRQMNLEITFKLHQRRSLWPAGEGDTDGYGPTE